MKINNKNDGISFWLIVYHFVINLFVLLWLIFFFIFVKILLLKELNKEKEIDLYGRFIILLSKKGERFKVFLNGFFALFL